MATTNEGYARDLGVFHNHGFSKALRNHEDIGEKTRKPGFWKSQGNSTTTPNLLRAAWLRDGLTSSVLLFPIYCIASSPRWRTLLSEALLKKGYMASSSQRQRRISGNWEKRAVESLIGRRLDALGSLPRRTRPRRYSRVSRQTGTPFVLIDRRFSDSRCKLRWFADGEVVRVLATEHLIEMAAEDCSSSWAGD